MIYSNVRRRAPGGGPRGFNLVELLVVIGVIGLLIAITLPAVQMARETARGAACENHLRQVGLAMHQFHDLHKRLPHNGGWDGQQQIEDENGLLFTPETHDIGLGRTFQWGVGDPQASVSDQPGSWLFSILPHAEEQSIYDRRAWWAPVEIYVCPSRRSADAHTVIASDAYGRYQGGGWKWSKSDYAGNALVVPGQAGGSSPHNEQFPAILDGLSQTILAGEKAMDLKVHTPQTWYWDEPFFLGGSAGTARRGLVLIKDGIGVDYKQNWGASHPAGPKFLMCDGSVRTIAYETSWNEFSVLLTPRHRDVIH